MGMPLLKLDKASGQLYIGRRRRYGKPVQRLAPPIEIQLVGRRGRGDGSIPGHGDGIVREDQALHPHDEWPYVQHRSTERLEEYHPVQWKTVGVEAREKALGDGIVFAIDDFGWQRFRGQVRKGDALEAALILFIPAVFSTYR